MTKLLTSTAVLLALAAPEMSRADTLPKELLGQWCVDGEFGNGVGAGLYDKGKCKKDRDDGVMTIKPNSVEYWEDGCNFTSIATRTPIGEIFTFLSGLYFRGKLAYAEAFARPPRVETRECS